MQSALPNAAIIIWGRDKAAAARLAAETGATAAPDVREAVAAADVICTATAAREPVLRAAWLQEGTHINAVGSSDRQARELGADIIAAADFYADTADGVRAECGEIRLAEAEGAIRPDHIRGEIAALAAGHLPGRSAKAALAVFKSVGCAGDDLAAASAVYAAAQAQNIGMRCRW